MAIKRRKRNNAGDIITKYRVEIEALLRNRRAGHNGSCCCHSCLAARKTLRGHLALVDQYIGAAL